MRSLQSMITVIPAALIAITFHEMCHAWSAYLLGDRTAQNAGRLSFNPISHLDPMGLLCMVLFGFGWAKPVPVNPRYFKNPKVGMALTAFAGPLSNFVLGFISLLLYVLIAVTAQNRVLQALGAFLSVLGTLNIGLGVFNLLPVPPLDGSKILFMFLPDRWVLTVYRYEGYIRLALILGLYFGLLNNVIVTGQSFVYRMFIDAALSICGAVGLV